MEMLDAAEALSEQAGILADQVGTLGHRLIDFAYMPRHPDLQHEGAMPMPMDPVTYVRDKKHALRGMLLVYQDLIDKGVIEDPPLRSGPDRSHFGRRCEEARAPRSQVSNELCDLLRSD